MQIPIETFRAVNFGLLLFVALRDLVFTLVATGINGNKPAAVVGLVGLAVDAFLVILLMAGSYEAPVFPFYGIALAALTTRDVFSAAAMAVARVNVVVRARAQILGVVVFGLPVFVLGSILIHFGYAALILR